MVAPIEGYTKNLKNAGQLLQIKTAGSNTIRSQLAMYANWLKAITERQKG